MRLGPVWRESLLGLIHRVTGVSFLNSLSLRVHLCEVSRLPLSQVTKLFRGYTSIHPANHGHCPVIISVLITGVQQVWAEA